MLSSCSRSYDKAIDPFFSPIENGTENFKIDSFNQNGKYYYLCKVWGFLKYHHTNIKKGEIDWDKQLLQTLKQVQSNPEKKEYERIILDLISQAGQLKFNKETPKINDVSYLNENFKWLNNQAYLSIEIKEKLLKIKKNNINYGDHQYVKTSSEGNLNFKTEKEYVGKSILQQEFRLLALFRYWNIINYFYPYKYDLGKNWDTVLSQYIPNFISCKNELNYNYLILKLTAEIKDSHVKVQSKVLEEIRGKYISNLNVLAIDSSWIVYKLQVKNQQSNLYVGDVLLELNDKPIQFYYDSLKGLISASNSASLRRDAAHYIFRTNKRTNQLTVIRKGDTLKLNEKFYEGSELWDQYIAERRSFSRKNVGKIIEDRIGYIKLEQIFENNQNMSFDWMFPKTSAIILDIRGYPNNTYNEVVQKFLNKKVCFWKYIYPDIDFPGAFRLNEKTTTIGTKNNHEIYQGLLIVLVDENTQSHAELSAMAFQLVPNMKVIGTQTAGADGNISTLALPGGVKTSFSGLGIFYPNLKKTQRIGIIPDIYVKRTLKGTIEGRDEILEAAVSYIQTIKN